MRRRFWFLTVLAVASLSACMGDLDLESTSQETHSWGNYHWARTADNFPLPVINSLTSDWVSYYNKAVGDWSQSHRLDMVSEAGDTSSRTRRSCSAPTGKVRVCNLAYGNTGWLGVAGISIDSNNHITRGYTKLNDTYFTTSYYNNDLWKQAVTCQEIGHDVGLAHQDENFNNTPLYSCMDYQDPPFPDPNAHDYDELDIIYGHLDSYNSYGSGGGGGGGTCHGRRCRSGNAVEGWGDSLGREGNHETFARHNHDGTIEITEVTWAEH